MTIYTTSNHPVDFYVYLYLREDGTPYYVGKGSKKRAWESHKRRNNTQILPPDNSRIKIVEHMLTEEEALALEKKLIAEYGRKDLGTGILRNLTNGGEGITGATFKQPEHANIKRSKTMAGRKYSKEHCSNIGKTKVGKSLSQEQKRKQSEKMKGRKQTPEHIHNNTLTKLGKPKSEVTKAKISATKTGVKIGPDIIITCPHCNKSGGSRGMKRYHFNNCRWQ